jgi:F-type H+-transporting ATPase subunit b
VSPTWTTFLFEVANFLVLAGALSWLYFKPVRQILVDRRAAMEADHREAALKLAEAETIQKEVSQTRANLQLELNKMRTRELDAARRQADQIVADARSEAQRERERTHREASKISAAQRDTLAEVSAAAAAETVGRLLTQIGGPELRSALIQSACRQLELLPHEGLSPVKVESTQPLSPDHLSMLKQSLGPVADSADFRTVSGLGDGVRISTGRGLIDASVNGLATFASQSLVKEMSRRANHHNPLQSPSDA